jgi:hypothetical protein
MRPNHPLRDEQRAEVAKEHPPIHEFQSQDPQDKPAPLRRTQKILLDDPQQLNLHHTQAFKELQRLNDQHVAEQRRLRELSAKRPPLFQDHWLYAQTLQRSSSVGLLAEGRVPRLIPEQDSRRKSLS